jgi:hypothetical protein
VWRTRGSIPYLARTLHALRDAGGHRTATTVWEEARELCRGISHEHGVRTLDARLTRAETEPTASNRR